MLKWGPRLGRWLQAPAPGIFLLPAHPLVPCLLEPGGGGCHPPQPHLAFLCLKTCCSSRAFLPAAAWGWGAAERGSLLPRIMCLASLGEALTPLSVNQSVLIVPSTPGDCPPRTCFSQQPLLAATSHPNLIASLSFICKRIFQQLRMVFADPYTVLLFLGVSWAQPWRFKLQGFFS